MHLIYRSEKENKEFLIEPTNGESKDKFIKITMREINTPPDLHPRSIEMYMDKMSFDHMCRFNDSL